MLSVMFILLTGIYLGSIFSDNHAAKAAGLHSDDDRDLFSLLDICRRHEHTCTTSPTTSNNTI